MICAPARVMSPALNPRTTPWVPTGMKAGVATVPWGRVSRPARARPSVASRWNSNISGADDGPERSPRCHARRGEHPIDLSPMDQVMAAHHADDQVEALRPPLAVDSHPRELRRRERTPERQIGGPHAAELAQRD